MANSRYPNMSYCMFENTKLAMEQLMDHMDEAIEDGPNACKAFEEEMSREERSAYHDMYYMCRSFIAKMEALEQQIDEAVEEDLAVE